MQKELAREERQGTENQIAEDRADSAGKGVTPTGGNSAADGHHVDRTNGRGCRQSHQECGRKHMDIRDDHHRASVFKHDIQWQAQKIL
jgi:hypothetical protein